MDNKWPLERQIKALLEMDRDELERELVGAVSRDEEFLSFLTLPTTEPPQPVNQLFASLRFSERIRQVRLALEDGLKRNRKALYDLICIKFRYCDQKGAGEVRFLGAVLTGLMGHGIILVAYPNLWPIPAVIVYLYKNGFFDRLCDCPKKKQVV